MPVSFRVISLSCYIIGSCKKIGFILLITPLIILPVSKNGVYWLLIRIKIFFYEEELI